MATTFHVNRSTAPSVSPTYGTSWTDTSLAVRRELVITSTDSAGRVSSTISDSDATQKTFLLYQFVSSPIAAQTIGIQSFNRVGFASEIASGNNMVLYYRVAVVSNDGSTERGEVRALQASGTEVFVDNTGLLC